MAASVVTIYNLALAALGTTSSLASPTEEGREAEQCNLWFEFVRDAIFRAAPWPRLTGYRRLALNKERDDALDWAATDPDPRWRFAYALPSDYLRPRYISTYAQFDESMIGDTPVLVTGVEDAILVYTRRITNVALWDIDLQHSVAFGLAAHIAKPLTGKDSDLQNMFQLAQDKILTARANAANLRNVSVESTPEWIAARGYSGAGPASRYIYPSADFTLAGFNLLG